jgi:hypothetical protein
MQSPPSVKLLVAVRVPTAPPAHPAAAPAANALPVIPKVMTPTAPAVSSSVTPPTTSLNQPLPLGSLLLTGRLLAIGVSGVLPLGWSWVHRPSPPVIVAGPEVVEAVGVEVAAAVAETVGDSDPGGRAVSQVAAGGVVLGAGGGANSPRLGGTMQRQSRRAMNQTRATTRTADPSTKHPAHALPDRMPLKIPAAAPPCSRYAHQAGLDHNMAPHRLRHFLFTWLKTQGIDDALIQPYSGHASRQSLGRVTLEAITKENRITALGSPTPWDIFLATKESLLSL